LGDNVLPEPDTVRERSLSLNKVEKNPSTAKKRRRRRSVGLVPMQSIGRQARGFSQRTAAAAGSERIPGVEERLRSSTKARRKRRVDHQLVGGWRTGRYTVLLLQNIRSLGNMA